MLVEINRLYNSNLESIYEIHSNKSLKEYAIEILEKLYKHKEFCVLQNIQALEYLPEDADYDNLLDLNIPSGYEMSFEEISESIDRICEPKLDRFHILMDCQNVNVEMYILKSTFYDLFSIQILSNDEFVNRNIYDLLAELQIVGD